MGTKPDVGVAENSAGVGLSDEPWADWGRADIRSHEAGAPGNPLGMGDCGRFGSCGPLSPLHFTGSARDPSTPVLVLSMPMLGGRYKASARCAAWGSMAAHASMQYRI